MRKWLALLLLLLTPSAAPAQQLSAYFQVGDSTPLTQVWETSTGGFVAPTSTNYQGYLSAQAAANNSGLASQICGVNNNGGLAQVQVCIPALIGGWATGLVRTVFGVGAGANGTWTITVDNLAAGLVTLQGSTFVASSSGTIGAAPLIDTATNLYGQIDKFNRFNFVSGQTYFVPSIITTSITLLNPPSPAYQVSMSNNGFSITLPQANLVGSIPIGQPIMFYNPASGLGFTVKDFTGATQAVVPATQSVIMMLLGNGTKQGNWTHLIGTN